MGSQSPYSLTIPEGKAIKKAEKHQTQKNSIYLSQILSQNSGRTQPDHMGNIIWPHVNAALGPAVSPATWPKLLISRTELIHFQGLAGDMLPACGPNLGSRYQG